ncbi:MAG: DUF2796 domain-containing protein [Gammaproteobacteria bacterium]|nr:DUF2796 domain-containing protein [Gammaproteobacteria bacterium]
MHTTIRFFSLLLIATVASLANAELAEHHDAHKHGTGKLDIVIEKSIIQINLESPADDIVGFEHKPKNKKQREAISKSVATLKNGNVLFIFNPEAGCKLQSADIESALISSEHAHNDGKHKHDKAAHANEESHADFDASYTFSCQNISRLKILNVNLFKDFPNLETLNVQLINQDRQSAAVISKKKSTITF